MTSFSSNRLVLAVLIIGFGTAFYSIPSLLEQIKDAAEAPPQDASPPAKRLQKDSENSLRIDTLRTLADGYSLELRTSAFKIVASRTVRSRTKQLLLHDLASKDWQRRDNAINAVWMLLYHPALTDTRILNELRDRRTITSLVCALINVLPLHQFNEKPAESEPRRLPPSPLRPQHRPVHEVSLITILTNLLRHSSPRQSFNDAMYFAAQAGLVTTWLAKYPFPCALPENAGFNFKRSDVVRLFDRMAWMTDDPIMAEVMFVILPYSQIRKQLVQVGLATAADFDKREELHLDGRWASTWDDEHENDHDNDHDVRMVGGDDTAGRARDDWDDWEEALRVGVPATGRSRTVERSSEEEHLRRRRREAIVVAERGAPLRRENILQRANSQVLQPMNGISEVEGELNGLLGLSGDIPTEGSDDAETDNAETNSKATDDSDPEDAGEAAATASTGLFEESSDTAATQTDPPSGIFGEELSAFYSNQPHGESEGVPVVPDHSDDENSTERALSHETWPE